MNGVDIKNFEEILSEKAIEELEEETDIQLKTLKFMHDNYNTPLQDICVMLLRKIIKNEIEILKLKTSIEKLKQ